jgi:hypothetical protein
VRHVAIACLTLGATFQSISLALQRHSGWTRLLRWIDCSAACPAMILAVGLQAGVRDVYTLECLFGLVWAAQILGLCADCMLHSALARADTDGAPGTLLDPLFRLLDTRAWAMPYVGAWATSLLAFAVIFEALMAVAAPPTAATHVLVWGELLLFVALATVGGVVSARSVCYHPNV